MKFIATEIGIALSMTILSAHAFASTPFADDSDLSGAKDHSQVGILDTPPLTLKPDELQVTTGAAHRTLEILRKDHDQWTPISGLEFNEERTRLGSTDAQGLLTLPACKPGIAVSHLQGELKDPRFAVTQDGQNTYKVLIDAPCDGHVKALFLSDTAGGQALGIWQVASRAEAKMKEAVGLEFWKSKIDFVWPGGADYYSWGEVHITRGDHWDVVGHELGHAIYDQGKIGQFGGGQHKIDECYSEALALSEGWASYFSAWVSVNLDDADAKFEYMVPRRAPIRFETIPSDVCKGDNNEWRVTGFFWDLLDFHNDQENSQETFAKLWNALQGTRSASAAVAANHLHSAGLSQEVLDLVWKLNF